MRQIMMPMVRHMKWPVRIAAFFVHLAHHTAAFFAWIWMLVNVVGTAAQAGLQANRLWETNLLMDVWREGLAYFTNAGGAGWQKLVAVALIPASVVAARNAVTAYDQFKRWAQGERPEKVRAVRY